MKILICAALALSVAACATPGPPGVSFPVQRADALARASHDVACHGVIAAHTAGALTGAAFNRAKALCIQADATLDVAEAMLALGQDAAAGDKISDAVALIGAAEALTPKEKP